MKTFGVCLAVALVAAADASKRYTYNIGGEVDELDARSTPPSACGPGNLGEAYYDTAAKELKVCDGTAWTTNDSRKIQTGSSAPTACAAGTTGTIYFDSTDKTLKICDGTSWEEVALAGANTVEAPLPASQMAMLPSGVTSNYRKDGAFNYLTLSGQSNLASNWEIEIKHNAIRWGWLELNVFESHMGGGFLNTAFRGRFLLNYYCTTFLANPTTFPLDTTQTATDAYFEVYRKKPFNGNLLSVPGEHAGEYGTEYSKDHCNALVIRKVAGTGSYWSRWFIEMKFHYRSGADLQVVRWQHD
jgi:hypothetical protein